MKSEPAKFWDKKILQWEKDKYSPNPVLFINFDVNSSIKSRIQLARSILKDLVPGQSVLELGCGSALLTEDILGFGAKKYVGVDISSVAIQAAKKRLSHTEIESKVEFLVSNVSDISPIKTDICFSLGLFDWLSPGEIALIQQKIETRFYFHTFSERKSFSPSQFLHRIYVYLLYGYKNSSYVPKYHSANDISVALDPNNSCAPKLLRRSDLSFGSVAYHLPDEVKDVKWA